MMIQFPRVSRMVALALAGLVVLAGCSNLPTKPAETADPGLSSAPSADGSGSGTSSTPPTSTTTAALSSTRTVTRLLGGTVRAGNFTVIVPPGALTSTALVTVTQPDPARPVVELSISPASANRFRLPVLLIADSRPMDKSLLAVSYMAYWNPSTSQWERVPNSTVSVLDMTVTAPLWHFSKYRVDQGGKAGW